MRWTASATTCLVAAALAGCGPKANRPAAETGTASDTAGGMSSMPADTSGMGNGTGAMAGDSARTDTAMRGGMSADTAAARSSTGDTSGSKTGTANQSESGVTNSKSKSSRLGPIRVSR